LELSWLKKIRGDKTMKEVGKHANISECYYSMIESGNRRPPIDTAKAIAKALNFDWQLFYDDDPSSRDSPGDTA